MLQLKLNTLSLLYEQNSTMYQINIFNVICTLKLRYIDFGRPLF